MRVLETWELNIYQSGLPGPAAEAARRPGCLDPRADGGKVRMEKREETGRREMVAPGTIIRNEAGMSGPRNSLLLSLLSPLEGVVQLSSRLSPLSLMSLGDFPQRMEQVSFLVPRLPERQSLGKEWVDGQWSRTRTGQMPMSRECKRRSEGQRTKTFPGAHCAGLKKQ